jgi:cell volume regulation protein A
MIKRDNEYIRPGGSTEIKANDVLLVLADSQKDFADVNDSLHKSHKAIKI